MQHENDSDNEFRLSVFDTLKGTLNQHRQMAEEGRDEQAFKKDEEIESEHFVYRSRTRSGADHSDVTQVGSLDPEQHRKQLSNRDFEGEIKLKKTYGIWLLFILAIQLLVMNAVFIVVGFKILEFDALTLQLYMGGTLTEVFGLVLVITKYLFNRK
ncbi:hypothetical protein [Escherichia coli]|uniref:hypothetical protein n=1 Tax=Escherichia coli TaxID=562 RepID=UPI000CFB1186|nr:hypothetical protein [Escherichia coli]